MDFGIVGETEDFLAVDKPAGLLVHPTKPGGPRTLWDGLCDLLGYELATGGQVSLINRLDRETSGIVLVAKKSLAATIAGKAMQRGDIQKEYLALAFGWPKWCEIEVNAPILRLGEVEESDVWLKRGVHPSGAPALTRFRVEARQELPDGRPVALVRAWPITGRTHQIRVHLAHVGFPVVGDKIYARGSRHYLDFIDRGWTEEMARELILPRQALHSARLTLRTPDGTIHDWHSGVPADMRELLPDAAALSSGV